MITTMSYSIISNTVTGLGLAANFRVNNKIVSQCCSCIGPVMDFYPKLLKINMEIISLVLIVFVVLKYGLCSQ
jgi:hypothetical protein